MIKSCIIFGGACETKVEMKDAQKRQPESCHIMTVSVLTGQDGVGYFTSSVYLKKETGADSENPLSQKAAKKGQYQNKINKILNVLSHTKTVRK